MAHVYFRIKMCKLKISVDDLESGIALNYIIKLNYLIAIIYILASGIVFVRKEMTNLMSKLFRRHFN